MAFCLSAAGSRAPPGIPCTRAAGKRKNRFSNEKRFLELIARFELATSSLPSAPRTFFQLSFVLYGHFRSNPLAFCSSLSTRFPPVPPPSVAGCVVRVLRQKFSRPDRLHKGGQIAVFLAAAVMSRPTFWQVTRESLLRWC